MTNKLIYSIFGFLTGLVVPTSIFILRSYEANKTWWIKWIRQEMHFHGDTYIVASIISVVIFSIFGYWIGNHHDELEQSAKSVEGENLTLSQLASTDALTGLFNARYIREHLDIEIENSHQSPLACILVDIDHFKKINDQYGHPAGDQVLIEVAKVLKRSVRKMDLVGRLGGEEFILILTGLPADRAIAISERIRLTVEETPFNADNNTINVTISLGLVTTPSSQLKNKEAILRAVDEALYQAKRSGRNRVVVWKEPDNTADHHPTRPL